MNQQCFDSLKLFSIVLDASLSISKLATLLKPAFLKPNDRPPAPENKSTNEEQKKSPDSPSLRAASTSPTCSCCSSWQPTPHSCCQSAD